MQAIDEARWRNAWDLKVFGYINLARAYYAAMRGRRKGVIVNVTGLAADRLDTGYIAGSTGNAALNAFSRTLGSHSIDEGIRVLAVSPGAVETERIVTLMKTRAADKPGAPERWREFLKALPLARPAAREDVAAAVACAAPPRVFASTASGTVPYAHVRYEPGDALMFGTETTGLAAEVLIDPHVTAQVRIPMLAGRRSLNLANCAALATYEAWRQLGFAGPS